MEKLATLIYGLLSASGPARRLSPVRPPTPIVEDSKSNQGLRVEVDSTDYGSDVEESPTVSTVYGCIPRTFSFDGNMDKTRMSTKDIKKPDKER